MTQVVQNQCMLIHIARSEYRKKQCLLLANWSGVGLENEILLGPDIARSKASTSELD
jgi:hypothetical protein